MEVESLGGHRYFATFIDNKTKKVYTYVMKTKDEVLGKFKQFESLVTTATGKRIKVLRTDNGREYLSNAFERYLQKKGIQRQLTTPYTPEQNGVAERMNRTLVEIARSLMFNASLPKSFWAEAITTATFLKNRWPTSSLENMTPEEAWSGQKPKVGNLKVFGCRAYVKIPDELRKKLDPKAKLCLFIGYSETSKAYRFLDMKTNGVIRGRDAVFNENEFPFSKKQAQESVMQRIKISTDKPTSINQDHGSEQHEDQLPSHEPEQVIQQPIPHRPQRMTRPPLKVRLNEDHSSHYANISQAEEGILPEHCDIWEVEEDPSVRIQLQIYYHSVNFWSRYI